MRTSSTSGTPPASPTATARRSELLEFARELAGHLIDRGAKLLVVACNSATAAALPALAEELGGKVPVVAVVGPRPGSPRRPRATGEVGLLATPATVASGAYERALAAAAPQAELTPWPPPSSPR